MPRHRKLDPASLVIWALAATTLAAIAGQIAWAQFG
jgi:hypothetical protein